MMNEVLLKIRDGRLNPNQALSILREQRQQQVTPQTTDLPWEERFQADLKDIVCKILKIDVEKIDVDIPVADMGLDSLSATEFNNQIRVKFGIGLQATAFFECNTLRDFYAYMCRSSAKKILSFYRVESESVKEIANTSSLPDPKKQNTNPVPKSTDPIRENLTRLWQQAEREIDKREEQNVQTDVLVEFADYELILTRPAKPNLHLVVTGNGKPVLLLGGLMNPETIWHKQVEALRENHQLILFNKPGVGKSGLDRHTLSIESIIDDIQFSLSSLNILQPIDIIGFSFGGMLAQQFACAFPDKVDRLVLINTTAKKTLRPNNVDILRDEVNHCPEVIKINGNLDFSVAARYGELSDELDLRDRLEYCETPTLIISSIHDQYIDAEQSKDLVSRLPNVHHHAIEARHFSLLTHAEEVNQHLLGFLNNER